MFSSTTHVIFGLFLVAIQIALLVPLIRHAARTRSIAGVSPTGEAIWTIAGAGWAVYGAWSGSIPLILSGTAACIGSGAVLLFTRASLTRMDWIRSATWSAITAVGLTMPTAVYGLPGLSYSLAAFGVIQFIRTTVRAKRCSGAGTAGTRPTPTPTRRATSPTTALFSYTGALTCPRKVRPRTLEMLMAAVW